MYVLLSVFLLCFNKQVFGQSLLSRFPSMRPNHPELDRYEEQCFEKLGIEKPNFREGKFASFKNLKCMMNCKMIKMGIMNESGEINLEKLIKYFNPNNDADKDELISKCSSIDEDDLCNKSFAIIKCLKPSYHFPKEILTYTRECLQELHMELPDPTETNRSPPKADDRKCLSACVAQKIGWMDETGNINKETLQKMLHITDSSSNNEKLNACFDNEKENLCEKAFEIEKCFKNEMRMRIKNVFS